MLLHHYEKSCSLYYKNLDAKFQNNSTEFATINAMSKITYAFFISSINPENKIIQKDIAIKDIKSRFSMSFRTFTRDCINFFKGNKSSNRYCLIGYKTSEVDQFLNARNSDAHLFNYFPTLISHNSPNKIKKEFLIFFQEYAKDLSEALDMEICQYEELTILGARLATQIEYYAIKSAKKIQRMNIDVLVTNSGNWRNRAIAAVCTAWNIPTIGFSHGNIGLTGFDPNHHIENDVLPVCNTAVTYSLEQMHDWELLCKENNRTKLKTNCILLDEKVKPIRPSKMKRFQDIKILLIGHAHNNKYYPMLNNYYSNNALLVEEKIIEALNFIPNIKHIAYKPHPSTLKLPSKLNCTHIHKDIPSETIMKNYDLVVFSHFKSTLFGYALNNQIPVLLFLDPEISISQNSLLKIKEICRIVDLKLKNKKFYFSNTQVKEAIFRNHN